MTQYFSYWVFLLSSTNLTLKVFFFSLLLGKYCLIHLEIVFRDLQNEIITLKSNLNKIMLCGGGGATLLRLLQFLSNLKGSNLDIAFPLTLNVTCIADSGIY